MKADFIRKALYEDLIPLDEFVIEKTITIDKDAFEQFIHNPLEDYAFIEDNIELMGHDKNKILHCIFITSEEHDFGILVESEGYTYARYSAYFPKALLEDKNEHE